jgi:hypothetical protein
MRVARLAPGEIDLLLLRREPRREVSRDRRCLRQGRQRRHHQRERDEAREYPLQFHAPPCQLSPPKSR